MFILGITNYIGSALNKVFVFICAVSSFRSKNRSIKIMEVRRTAALPATPLYITACTDTWYFGRRQRRGRGRGRRPLSFDVKSRQNHRSLLLIEIDWVSTARRTRRRTQRQTNDDPPPPPCPLVRFVPASIARPPVQSTPSARLCVVSEYIFTYIPIICTYL